MRYGILMCWAKALEFIQLCAYNILGCSVITCDELVHADLGLESSINFRSYRKM